MADILIFKEPRKNRFKKPVAVQDLKLRTCLGPLCRGRKKFWSSHKGNRLCKRCQATVARDVFM